MALIQESVEIMDIQGQSVETQETAVGTQETAKTVEIQEKLKEDDFEFKGLTKDELDFVCKHLTTCELTGSYLLAVKLLGKDARKNKITKLTKEIFSEKISMLGKEILQFFLNG